MKRYVAIVEQLDWDKNTCKIRVPNRDGFGEADYQINDIVILRQIRTATSNLQNAEIPRHLQGLRKGDVVLCIDAQSQNDNPIIVSYHGGTANI